MMNRIIIFTYRALVFRYESQPGEVDNSLTIPWPIVGRNQQVQGRA
jgi:hypothetical protein